MSETQKRKPFYLNQFSFTRRTPGVKDHLKKRGLYNINLLSSWERIIGNGLVRYSVPDRIHNVMGKKVLHVFVYETRIIEYQHQKQTILAHINMLAGYPLIDDIKFIRKRKLPKIKSYKKDILKSSPTSPHPFIEKEDGFENPLLKKAFNNLAHAILPIDQQITPPQNTIAAPSSASWIKKAKNIF